MPGGPRGLRADPLARAAAVPGGPAGRTAGARLIPRRFGVAATGAAGLALAAFALAQARLDALASLALGRERLLAFDLGQARAAFAAARRFPGPSDAARAALELTAAAAGTASPEAPATPAGFARLGVPGEALVLAALEAGRLEPALALARVMRRTGDPAGALYEAALLFEAGDEAQARRVAGLSAAPLGSRGPGARLARAFAARDAGARTLLFDDRGELLASIDATGGLHAEPGSAPLLAAIVPRLAPFGDARAVRLALDAELSRVALDALGDARGSIVLVDAPSGAVRAAVSDARTAAAEPGAAFTERREPASIAKLLTAAAAYRAGRDPDTAIARMTCTGVERYSGQPLWCATAAGPLGGLDRALAWSCNVAFANVAVEIGQARLEEEFRRWGFGRSGAELLGAAGRIHSPPRTARQLADLAVGLEAVDVTPLHAALLAALVANDGRLVEPWLASGECGALGLVHIAAPRVAPAAVIDVAVARRLGQAMRAVTRYGTGAGLAPPRVAVAMKTGTAADPGRGYHVNYVGWLEHGSLAFCIRVTHERSSPAVTRRAREVSARLFVGLAQRLAREKTASGAVTRRVH